MILHLSQRGSHIEYANIFTLVKTFNFSISIFRNRSHNSPRPIIRGLSMENKMKTKEQVLRNKSKLTCCNAYKMCKKILMLVTVKCILISILMIYVAILMKVNNLAITLIDSYFFVKNLFSLTFIPIMNGIFLFCISIMGLVGAIKHHRQSAQQDYSKYSRIEKLTI